MKEENGHIVYLRERVQKITEALYRVTDLFSDQEPLKWLLRKEGIEVLDSVLKIQTSLPSDRIRHLDLTIGHIQRSIQILQLASSNSFISETNFQVLKREYNLLIDFMTDKRTKFLPEPIAFIEAADSKPATDRSEKPIGHTIGHNDNGHSKEENVQYNTGSNERKEQILSFVRDKDWVSIGELTALFEGQISEKTLQRDLLSLTNNGLLLKEGDKRWRRYKVARV
ncbi:DeoR family transcriptional regulator [Patescibacteria group bacterium]|nr:DeoR family transcriptional regulator [Patescibacteria group bacterium]